MALSKNNKKLLIFGGIFSFGILAYLLFKNGKKIRFVDNVWCADSQCSNVDPATYVSFSGKFINASGDNNNTGNVNLLFTEPHNLSAGEEILVKMKNVGVVGYLLGIAGLAVSVYVASRAWSKGQEDQGA